MDRQVYMERKFGAGDRIRKAHEHLTALGAEVGIPFAFDRIKVSPNTLDAHRLIRWAGEPALQDEVVEALFRAYFIEGREHRRPRGAGRHRRGRRHGSRRASPRASPSDEDRAEVQADIRSAQRIGVTGVPTFIVANRYGLVGAQPAEELARAFEQVAAEEAGETAGRRGLTRGEAEKKTPPSLSSGGV